MSQVAILLTASIMFQGDVATAGTELLVDKSLAADLFARGRAVPASSKPLKLDADAPSAAQDDAPLAAIEQQGDQQDGQQGDQQDDQQEIDLEKLELPQLRELCTEHNISFAANASAKSLREKLYAAFGGE